MLVHAEGSSLQAGSRKGFALPNCSGKETLEGTRGRGWRRAPRGQQAGTAGTGPAAEPGLARPCRPGQAAVLRPRDKRVPPGGCRQRRGKAEGKPASACFSQRCWRLRGRGRKRGRTFKSRVTASCKNAHFSSGLPTVPSLMSIYCP